MVGFNIPSREHFDPEFVPHSMPYKESHEKTMLLLSTWDCAEKAKISRNESRLNLTSQKLNRQQAPPPINTKIFSVPSTFAYCTEAIPDHYNEGPRMFERRQSVTSTPSVCDAMGHSLTLPPGCDTNNDGQLESRSFLDGEMGFESFPYPASLIQAPQNTPTTPAKDLDGALTCNGDQITSDSYRFINKSTISTHNSPRQVDSGDSKSPSVHLGQKSSPFTTCFPSLSEEPHHITPNEGDLCDIRFPNGAPIHQSTQTAVFGENKGSACNMAESTTTKQPNILPPLTTPHRSRSYTSMHDNNFDDFAAEEAQEMSRKRKSIEAFIYGLCFNANGTTPSSSSRGTSNASLVSSMPMSKRRQIYDAQGKSVLHGPEKRCDEHPSNRQMV